MRAIDCMGFAGSFAVGVSQAGFDVVAKREPSAFGGFGAAAFERNMPQVQVEVTEAEFWSVVKSDYVYGCPPCSGFSMLSTNNTVESNRGPIDENGVRHSLRGVDSPVNQWMHRLVEYAAKVRPEVVVFESVPSGGKMGQPLMRALWQKLRDQTGIDYHFTDVFMNAALIGGNVIRPRYFWVAHTRPFGVDIPTGSPKPMRDVIGDLLQMDGTRLDAGVNQDWGHVTAGSPTADRIQKTIELFRTEGYDWSQGKRLPEHLDVWVNQMGHEVPEWWYKADGNLYSHAVSDNMYSPFRWRWDTPMGVVAGGFMERAVHPVEARTFTYREGARFMGLPDSWSLRPIVQGNNGPWLGKAIPVSSGRWISTAAYNSIEGTPGEYAGILVEPKHRVIDVTTPQKVKLVESGRESAPDWWPDRPRRTYSYATVGHTGRPLSFAPLVVRPAELVIVKPAMEPHVAVKKTPTIAAPMHFRPTSKSVVPPPPTEDEADVSPIAITVGGRPLGAARVATPAARLALRPAAMPVPAPAPRPAPKPTPRPQQGRGGAAIVRMEPQVIQAFLDQLGLSRAQTAEALGYSPSRIAEMTSHSRPQSWLNATRWPDLQEKLLAYCNSPA